MAYIPFIDDEAYMKGTGKFSQEDQAIDGEDPEWKQYEEKMKTDPKFRMFVGQASVDAASNTGQVLQGPASENLKQQSVPSLGKWMKSKRAEVAAPGTIPEKDSPRGGLGYGTLESVGISEPEQRGADSPSELESHTPSNQGAIDLGPAALSQIVSAKPSNRVPAPFPQEAIPSSQKPPAQSIKEYLALMKSQGQAPMFTNIQGRPDSMNQPGVGPAYQMPQDPGMNVHMDPNTGQPVSSGTMDVNKIMKKSEGGYDPTGDPFQGATDLAMQDAPRLWDMLTGGGVPMDTATPEQYKKMSAALAQVRDHYLEATTQRRKEYIGLVEKGALPSEAAQILKGGSSAATLKTMGPLKDLDQKSLQTRYGQIVDKLEKAQTEMGKTLTPEMKSQIQQQALVELQQTVEAVSIVQKNSKQKRAGAIDDQSSEGQQGANKQELDYKPYTPSDSEEKSIYTKFLSSLKSEEEKRNFNAMLNLGRKLKETIPAVQVRSTLATYPGLGDMYARYSEFVGKNYTPKVAK